MDQKKIGEFLTSLRKAKGKTQQQVADDLFVSPKSVSRWESGDGLPDINLLEAVSSYYGVTVDELLKGEKKNAEREEHLSLATLQEKERQKDKLVASSLEKKQLPVFIVAISLLGLFGIVGLPIISVPLPACFAVGLAFLALAIVVSPLVLSIGNKVVVDTYVNVTDENFSKGLSAAREKIFHRNLYYCDLYILILLPSILLFLSAVPFPIIRTNIVFFFVTPLLSYFLIRTALAKKKDQKYYPLLVKRLRLSVLVFSLALAVCMFYLSFCYRDSGSETTFNAYSFVGVFLSSKWGIFKTLCLVFLLLEIGLAIAAYALRWDWMEIISLLFSLPVTAFAYYGSGDSNYLLTGARPSTCGSFLLILFIALFVWLVVLKRKIKLQQAKNSMGK